MKLATWNINSIRARTERLLTWLGNEQPDVLCLQETKVEDSGFPIEALRARGYEVVTYGQRSYNGVAIAARAPLTDVVRGFGDGEPDDEARLIAATVSGLRVVCVYVPNGQDLTSDKYTYKLAWYQRLRRFLDRTASATDRLVVCGDMNVTADDRDVCDPVKWAGQIHCSAPERAALAELLAFPLVDLFRMKNPDGGVYSWWDYRGVAFFKNQGLRIDYIFATSPVAERCTACTIDRNARKGQDASDHAPVIATLEL
ncbi:MAG TPA: exodeoxyribonuclease III [Kofleriaceae bacterium]|nr:exodeoxyribonuclease III [Kofleriaceae bacterium]